MGKNEFSVNKKSVKNEFMLNAKNKQGSRLTKIANIFVLIAETKPKNSKIGINLRIFLKNRTK